MCATLVSLELQVIALRWLKKEDDSVRPAWAYAVSETVSKNKNMDEIQNYSKTWGISITTIPNRPYLIQFCQMVQELLLS